MNEIIARINSRYKAIQEYVHPTTKEIDNILVDKAKLIEFQEKRKIFDAEYEELVKELLYILDSLSPTEIALAYKKGCRLLQMNLSGYMGNNFSSEYIEVMETAIKSKHFHTAWLFLQALADNIGQDVEPVVDFALQIEPLQATALSIVRQLKLQNLLPKAKELLNNPDAEIKIMAKAVIETLES